MALDRLIADLRALGIGEGRIVLVHSSLRALGPVEGGADAVIDALLAALGPRGTLALPALSWQVDAAHPDFDVRRTPSCVGALAERFRLRPGTRRSLAPTHSVCAVGPASDALLGEHHLDGTPCGARSPFRRLRELDGLILFLGCGLAPNTSMHAVEEVAGSPYLFGGTVDHRVVREDGAAIAMRVRRHGFAGWTQRYDRLEPLLGAEALTTGPVLGGRAHLVRARPMWDVALAALRADPYRFVDRAEPAAAGGGATISA